RLPRDVNPAMAPIASIMGEVRLIGLRSTATPGTPARQAERAMELRTLAEFTLRNRLLAIEGVAQVTVMGGGLKQYQVVTSPARLRAAGVTLDQLTEAAARANAVTGVGVMQGPNQEATIRVGGRSMTLQEVAQTPVVWRAPRPVLIGEVADVR